MSHERKIGVGAHPEEDVHPSREHKKGISPAEQDKINRYALERARAKVRGGRRARGY